MNEEDGEEDGENDEIGMNMTTMKTFYRSCSSNYDGGDGADSCDDDDDDDGAGEISAPQNCFQHSRGVGRGS